MVETDRADEDEARALFRLLIEEARAGDAESRAVLAERVGARADDPEWAELVAQARAALDEPSLRPVREWRRRWEPEGVTAGGRARTMAALFVIALTIGAAVILSG